MSRTGANVPGRCELDRRADGVADRQSEERAAEASACHVRSRATISPPDTASTPYAVLVVWPLSSIE